jgi:uncharacterized membrane protein YdbT with pleckstrin-like domain
MSYVDSILQPDEKVIHKAQIHWLIYLPAVLNLVIFGFGGVFILVATPLDPIVGQAAAAFGFVFSFIQFLRAWLTRYSSEIAVTDRRIIFKEGLIRRETTEMNMTKVESVNVDQSILGRLLDYGDITVRGTGAGLSPLRMIQNPLAFRNAVIAR